MHSIARFAVKFPVTRMTGVSRPKDRRDCKVSSPSQSGRRKSATTTSYTLDLANSTNSREDRAMSISTFNSASSKARTHSRASPGLSTRNKILMISFGPSVGAAMGTEGSHSLRSSLSGVPRPSTVLSRRHASRDDSVTPIGIPVDRFHRETRSRSNERPQNQLCQLDAEHSFRCFVREAGVTVTCDSLETHTMVSNRDYLV